MVHPFSRGSNIFMLALTLCFCDRVTPKIFEYVLIKPLFSPGWQSLGPPRLRLPADVQHLQELQHLDRQRADPSHQDVLRGTQERESAARLLQRRHRGIRSPGQTINRFKYKQMKKVKSLKQATELLNKQKRLNVLKKQLKEM